MKHFDPQVGWSADADPSPPASAAAPAAGAAPSAATPGKVANFSRHGTSLHVIEIHSAAAETAKLSAAAQIARPATPADAAAIGQSLDEVFAVLSAGDASGVAISEVSATLRGLAALTAEQRRLEGELQAVNVRLASMQQLLDGHVAAARDSELRALEVCKLRVELVQELAASLLPKQPVRGGQ